MSLQELREHIDRREKRGTASYGEVDFQISCGPAVQKTFKEAVWTLHSFWYPEALKGFTAVTEAEPGCAMGYWGIAMSHWYPLWYPPTSAALKAGAEAVEKAVAAGPKSERERDYIAAIAPSIAIATNLIITPGPSPTRRRWNKSTYATLRIARPRCSTGSSERIGAAYR